MLRAADSHHHHRRLRTRALAAGVCYRDCCAPGDKPPSPHRRSSEASLPAPSRVVSKPTAVTMRMFIVGIAITLGRCSCVSVGIGLSKRLIIASIVRPADKAPSQQPRGWGAAKRRSALLLRLSALGHSGVAALDLSSGDGAVYPPRGIKPPATA
jgi:hypothetical protein